MSQTSLELTALPAVRLGHGSNASLGDEPVTPSQTNLVQDSPKQDGRDAPVTGISRSTTAVVIFTVTGVTSVACFISGLWTVAIATIAKDVNLADSLLLWPASIYALVCGCTLLISGSLCDVLGNRFTYLLGTFLQALFTLASGLARNGSQMIVFRAFSGLAMSFCLPSATSIISTNLPSGKQRNAGFACMGGGQPLGFSLGLVFGGVFAQTIGWRWGFYIGAILNVIVLGVAVWGLPKHESNPTESYWSMLKSKIDWVGASLATACLAMLSYVFA